MILPWAAYIMKHVMALFLLMRSKAQAAIPVIGVLSLVALPRYVQSDISTRFN